MKPCEVVVYKGEKVVIVDVSDSAPEEQVAYYAHAHEIIAQFPPKSALILTIGTNARFNQDSAAAIKEFAIQNTPYVKASAAIGAEGLREITRISIERRTERNVRAFNTYTEAMDWLVSQK